MISIIVPAYNEAKRLTEGLKEIKKYCDKNLEQYEVIFVNDGSTDNTLNTVIHNFKQNSSWEQLRIISYNTNRGKGYAIRKGVLSALGDYIVFTDADLSTPIVEIEKLLAEIKNENDIAIASRYIKESKIIISQPLKRVIMGKIYNLLVRLIVLPGFHDTQCGCKMFTREAAILCFQPLKIPRFGFDIEILLRARKNNFSIKEVPVEWKDDNRTTISSLRDSIEMFIDLLKLRFKKIV